MISYQQLLEDLEAHNVAKAYAALNVPHLGIAGCVSLTLDGERLHVGLAEFGYAPLAEPRVQIGDHVLTFVYAAEDEDVTVYVDGVTDYELYDMRVVVAQLARMGEHNMSMNELAKFFAANLCSRCRSLEHLRTADQQRLAPPAATEFLSRIKRAYYPRHDPMYPRFANEMLWVINASEAFITHPFSLRLQGGIGAGYQTTVFYFKDNVMTHVVMLVDDPFDEIEVVYVADVATLDFDFNERLSNSRFKQLPAAVQRAASTFDRYGEPLIMENTNEH